MTPGAGLAPVVAVVVLGVVSTWFLLVEALHAGTSIAAVLPGRHRRRPAWRVLGALVLLDEVWLVLLLAWVQTAFPALEHRLWGPGLWPVTLAAVLLSVAQFALLLLSPVLLPGLSRGAVGGASPDHDRTADRRLQGLQAVVGVSVVLAWCGVLAGLADASATTTAVAAVLAAAAATLVGLAAQGWHERARGAAWSASGTGAAATALVGASGVVALTWAALVAADPALVSPGGGASTLRLLAWAAALTAAPLLAGQGLAWRWVLRNPDATDWLAAIVPDRSHPAGPTAGGSR